MSPFYRLRAAELASTYVIAWIYAASLLLD